MGEIVDGKQLADEIVARVKSLTSALVETGASAPGLAVVIVGEDPASQVYVSSKGKKAVECGFHSVGHSLAADTTEGHLLETIANLNADPAIHGILVQLPLPPQIDSAKVIQAIAPHKDVDGFHHINVGKLGAGEAATAFVPCTCLLYTSPSPRDS